jgi:hypothetical protein
MILRGTTMMPKKSRSGGVVYTLPKNILTTTAKTGIISTVAVQITVGLNGEFNALTPMGDFATSTVPNDVAGDTY